MSPFALFFLLMACLCLGIVIGDFTAEEGEKSESEGREQHLH